MRFPLQVSFHNTRRSTSAEEEVREYAEKLDKYHSRIQNCEVFIDKPHHHQTKGNEFQVKILLSVPGQKIAVSPTSPKHGDHNELHVALRDAFEAARRQLRERKDKPREKRNRQVRQTDGPDGMVSAPA